MEYQTLNNGLKMPIVGFGVFRVPDKKECEESVYQAIKAGYRLIDTAASYTNEDAVGAGVKRAIEEGVCTRKDLFITSKMWVQDMKNYETAKRAIDASIEKSGLGYLDLYLLHQAMGDYFSAWRAMEDAYKEGKLKAIRAWGGYIGFSHNWCKVLTSNIMYSYARVLDRYGMPTTSYKYAQYAAANLFWDFSEYGSCAIEYVFGRRNDFNKDYGNASRINTMIQYRF